MIGALHAFFAAAPLAVIALALALGYLCGKLRVGLAAGSNVPVLGYTVPYTLANVLLTLAGPRRGADEVSGSPHGRAGSCVQRLDHGLECVGRRSRPMVVRSLKRMATAVLLAALALPAPGAAIEIPPRKVEINKFTCGEFSSLATGEERDRVLIYMNGYLDGTRKTAVWDAGAVGKRVDEVLRLCREDPKLTVLNAFKRAWRQ